jgi:hypothetical protein
VLPVDSEPEAVVLALGRMTSSQKMYDQIRTLIVIVFLTRGTIVFVVES